MGITTYFAYGSFTNEIAFTNIRLGVNIFFYFINLKYNLFILYNFN